MTLVVIESTISAGERPQTYALDRVAIGTGNTSVRVLKCKFVCLSGPG